jgi:hypothetical protein
LKEETEKEKQRWLYASRALRYFFSYVRASTIVPQLTMNFKSLLSGKNSILEKCVEIPVLNVCL